jgi:transposase
MERETGIEPATNSLEGCDSTTELLPLQPVGGTPAPMAPFILSHHPRAASSVLSPSRMRHEASRRSCPRSQDIGRDGVRAVERVQTGESPEVVIQALGFTHSCVYAWLALVPDRELGSPENPCLKGRQLKIQAPQMRWLYRTITGKTPCSSGSSLLCGRERSSVCCCEGSSKLKLSLANVGRLLKQLGLTCQHPLFRATEQDPERVRPWHWITSIYAGIGAAGHGTANWCSTSRAVGT